MLSRKNVFLGTSYSISHSLTHFSFISSHFVYELSGGSMLVSAHYVTATLADHTVVHCRDRNLFGTTNKGMEAIYRIQRAHRCSTVCRAMGLALTDSPSLDQRAAPLNDLEWVEGAQAMVTSPIKHNPALASASSPTQALTDAISPQVSLVTDIETATPRRTPLANMDPAEREAIQKKFRTLQQSLAQPLLQGLRAFVEPGEYPEQPLDLPRDVELRVRDKRFVFYNYATNEESNVDPRGPGATLPAMPSPSLLNMFSKWWSSTTPATTSIPPPTATTTTTTTTTNPDTSSAMSSRKQQQQ
jgi:hypothetical protein